MFIRDLPEIWNRKYIRLSFAQYLETGKSKDYQIWHKGLPFREWERVFLTSLYEEENLLILNILDSMTRYR